MALFIIFQTLGYKKSEMGTTLMMGITFTSPDALPAHTHSDKYIHNTAEQQDNANHLRCNPADGCITIIGKKNEQAGKNYNDPRCQENIIDDLF